MEALLLVGHGSLRPGAGAAMIRLAARLREEGVAPLAAAGFLNYSRPTFQEALGKLVARGASSLVLQPYFLVRGVFVREAVPRLLATALKSFPGLGITLAGPLGDRPALARLARRRAEAAGAEPGSAVLLAAHGTPNPNDNAPVHAVAAMLRESRAFAAVEPCFLGLNAPAVPEAIAAQVAAGQRQITVVPYMLQLGGHVADDFPALLDAARRAHPGVHLALAEHLGYDPLLAEAVAESVASARQA